VNDSTAVQRLVEGHREFLAFLQRRVESREVAEDILQAAFVKGLEHEGEIPEEKIVPWFYRVLRNAVIDHYRSRSAAAGAADSWAREASAWQEPDEHMQDEVCACVTSLLETLKPEYRDALRSVDLDDLSLAEFASRAGISENNAAVRVHRARTSLRNQVRRACGTCAEHGCVDCSCRAGGCG
jgi:RNA polymerase sigma-70 factor (ECF subfamily)